MFIIDKNKDFYDYVSNIYGVEKNITISMTEKQKAESHGFDENSFKNSIKL